MTYKAPFSLEKINIKKLNDHIFYYGLSSQNSSVAGVIDKNGDGEEIIIAKDRLKRTRKHKIKKYKTKLCSIDLKSEYFTKNNLENLERVRAF